MMRKLFENRYFKEEAYYEDLLSNATVVLDTNVLLSLYRFSVPTRNYFLSVLKEIQNRLWLPYQAGNEFFYNRLPVICGQISAYSEFEKSLSDIENKLEDKKCHPFLSEKAEKKLNSALIDINSELKSSKGSYEQLIYKDIILSEVMEIYNDKVGNEYPVEILNEKIEIAKKRYENKIPPGFMDFKTKGGGKNDDSLFGYEKTRPYGDYIFWSQIVDYAKNNKDIIIVTDDVKEDWYIRTMGKTNGPRHELLDEFKRETGKNIYIYQSDKFIERMEVILGKNKNIAAVDEIKAVKISIEHDNEPVTDWRKYFNIKHGDIENNGLLISKIENTKENDKNVLSWYDTLQSKYINHIIRNDERSENEISKLNKIYLTYKATKDELESLNKIISDLNANSPSDKDNYLQSTPNLLLRKKEKLENELDSLIKILLSSGLK